MGNAVCMFDKCGSTTDSPISFLEYEYFKPLQDEQERLSQKRKRMDIMESAMQQALFDVKYYMGMQKNSSDGKKGNHLYYENNGYGYNYHKNSNSSNKSDDSTDIKNIRRRY